MFCGRVRINFNSLFPVRTTYCGGCPRTGSRALTYEYFYNRQATKVHIFNIDYDSGYLDVYCANRSVCNCRRVSSNFCGLSNKRKITSQADYVVDNFSNHNKCLYIYAGWNCDGGVLPGLKPLELLALLYQKTDHLITPYEALHRFFLHGRGLEGRVC